MTSLWEIALPQQVSTPMPISRSQDQASYSQNRVSYPQVLSQMTPFTLTKKANLEGRLWGFLPNDQGIITYDSDANQSFLWSMEGAEIGTLAGIVIRASSDGQTIGLSASAREDRSRLVTLDGTERHRFEGTVVTFAPEEPQVFVYSHQQDRTSLFDFEGKALASFKGMFFKFGPEHQSLITYSSSEERYYLFTPEGGELASFPSRNNALEFTSDGQQVVLSNISGPSQIFDLQGAEQAAYEGRFLSFTPDEQTLITYIQKEDVSHLLSLAGQHLATFPGFFQTFTSD
ncbi:MAG: hypothetical protein AAGE59_39435, partial [Cyanobacteria bacterium P01_F01_bin.86]